MATATRKATRKANDQAATIDQDALMNDQAAHVNATIAPTDDQASPSLDQAAPLSATRLTRLCRRSTRRRTTRLCRPMNSKPSWMNSAVHRAHTARSFCA